MIENKVVVEKVTGEDIKESVNKLIITEHRENLEGVRVIEVDIHRIEDEGGSLTNEEVKVRANMSMEQEGVKSKDLGELNIPISMRRIVSLEEVTDKIVLELYKLKDTV